jgi:hypothetical protein
MIGDQKLFVGGIERSGTTLLGASLARFVAGLVIPEANFKAALISSDGSQHDKLLQIKKNFRYRIWDLDNTAVADAVVQGLPIYDAIVYAAKASFPSLPNSKLIIDHTPDNLAKASIIDEGYHPLAFLYVIRDPRATVLSIMRTDWGLPSVRSAVEFWCRRYEEDLRGLEHLQAKSADRLHIVRYEDLCMDAEATVNSAIKDLRLPINNGGQSGLLVPRYTASQHTRLFQPAVDLRSWKHALTASEVAYIVDATSNAWFASRYNFENETKATTPVLPFSDRLRELRKPLHRASAHLRRRRRGLEALVI